MCKETTSGYGGREITSHMVVFARHVLVHMEQAGAIIGTWTAMFGYRFHVLTCATHNVLDAQYRDKCISMLLVGYCCKKIQAI